MKYRKLGDTNLNVSLICLGTMSYGEQNTEKDAHQQLDFALDHGINFIDTAEMYAIIAKKPIIICNFFHSKPDVLVKIGLAIECIDPSNLLKSIEKANHILEYDKKRSDFIDEYFYKPDGRASERISDTLLKLLTKNIL